jgi:hypothetical protein
LIENRLKLVAGDIEVSMMVSSGSRRAARARLGITPEDLCWKPWLLQTHYYVSEDSVSDVLREWEIKTGAIWAMIASIWYHVVGVNSL